MIPYWTLKAPALVANLKVTFGIYSIWLVVK
jgi:hypothetical protein